ncbi:MAG TPA: hypothetical protein VFD64_09645 [Gemmatimonadaceae bacterium]|nr:hypothetical protein [Gemmatimonadaceae bacterium]
MLNPDFRDILSAFTAAGVEYLVVGAYAVAAHGLPRATGDIDLFVRPTLENARRVWNALAAFGAPLERVEVADFTREGTILQVGLVPRRIDVITAIEAVSFEDAWQGRVELELDGLTLPVIGLPELLKNKRAVGRPQDRADVERLQGLLKSKEKPAR